MQEVQSEVLIRKSQTDTGSDTGPVLSCCGWWQNFPLLLLPLSAQGEEAWIVRAGGSVFCHRAEIALKLQQHCSDNTRPLSGKQTPRLGSSHMIICHREIPNNHDLIYLKCRRLSLGPDCIALWLILNLSLHFHKAPLWLPQSKLVLRV